MPRVSLEAAKLTDAEFYQAVRAQIVHEDDLIAQRLSWLVSSQSFLFTAYAIVLNGPLAARNAIWARQQLLIYQVIPGIAMVSAILIYCGIIAGTLAMHSLRRAFQAHFEPQGPSVVPAIQGNGRDLVLGHIAPLTLPVIFAAVWVVIWIRGVV